MPVPYINRAIVQNSAISVELVFYLVMPEEEDPTVIEESLDRVTFYVGQIFDSKVGEVEGAEYTDSEDSYGTKRVENLLNAEGGVMSLLVNMIDNNDTTDYFINAEDETYTLERHKELASVYFSNFEQTSTRYDDSGNKIIEYTTKTLVGLPTPLINGTNTELFKDSSDYNFSMSLVSFSSILELTDYATTTGNETINRIRSDDRYLELYESFFSQANYENCFKDGSIIANATYIMYETENGNFHGTSAVQSISGDFHAEEQITKTGILNRLQSLSSEASPMSGSAFAGAVNGLSYTLSTYSSQSGLLPQLEIFRQSFVDQSRVSNTGRWYHRYNLALSRIDDLVQRGEKLNQRNVTSPTVRDWRGMAFETFEDTTIESGEYDIDAADDEFLYTGDGQFLLSRLGAFDPSAIEGEIDLLEFAYDYTLIENGFLFFDYGKAKRKRALFSNYFVSVSKFESLFGRDLLNKYFYVYLLTANRKHQPPEVIPTFEAAVNADTYNCNSFDLHMSHTAEIGGHSGMSVEKLVYQIEQDPLENECGLYKLPYETAEEMTPLLIPRNVVLPTNRDFDTYQIMAFEYQNLMPSAGLYGSSPRDSDQVKFNCYIIDNSLVAANVVLSSVITFFDEEFTQYLEAAEEYCNYNNISGYFNDFFIEAMDLKYTDDPLSAPWIKGPSIYTLHNDLMYDAYNGNMPQMREAAISIAKQLNPHTGTLEDLRKFYENFKKLRDIYYFKRLTNVSVYNQLGGPNYPSFTTTVKMTEQTPPDFLNLGDFDAGNMEYIFEADKQRYIDVIAEVYDIYSEMYRFILTKARDYTSAADSDEKKADRKIAKGKIKAEIYEQLMLEGGYIDRMGNLLMEVKEISVKAAYSDEYEQWTSTMSGVPEWIARGIWKEHYYYSQGESYENTIPQEYGLDPEGEWVSGWTETGWNAKTSGGHVIRFVQVDTNAANFTVGVNGAYYNYNYNSYDGLSKPDLYDGQLGNIALLDDIIQNHFSGDTGDADWSSALEDNLGIAVLTNSQIKARLETLFCAAKGNCKKADYDQPLEDIVNTMPYGI